MPNQDKIIFREDIIYEARKWTGTPWTHQGRTKEGIDCAGLIILVGNTLGLLDFDTTNYQRRTHGTAFLKYFKTHMKQKNILNALPGDVLLFRDNQYPCHSAIVLTVNEDRHGPQTIIHAHALRRKVLEERLDQGDWMKRLVACFEYKGLDD